MNENYYVDTTYGLSTTSGLTGAFASMGILIVILFIISYVLIIVSLWKIFKKAGKPGWASIIPIYNIYVICQIAEKKWWNILLLLIPIANIYAMIVLYNGLAKKFGKSGGFVVGMILLPIIFFPILAFSGSKPINVNQTNDDSKNINQQPTNEITNINTMPINDNIEIKSQNNNEQVKPIESINTNIQNSESISSVNIMQPTNEITNINTMPINDNIEIKNQNNNGTINPIEDINTNIPTNANMQDVNTSETFDMQDITDISDNIDIEKHSSMWSNNQNNSQNNN